MRIRRIKSANQLDANSITLPLEEIRRYTALFFGDALEIGHSESDRNSRNSNSVDPDFQAFVDQDAVVLADSGSKLRNKAARRTERSRDLGQKMLYGNSSSWILRVSGKPFNWNFPFIFCREPTLWKRDRKTGLLCATDNGAFPAQFEDRTFHPYAINTDHRQVSFLLHSKWPPKAKCRFNNILRYTSAVVAYREFLIRQFKVSMAAAIRTLCVRLIATQPQHAIDGVV